MTTKPKGPRFDLVEVACIVLFCALVVWIGVGWFLGSAVSALKAEAAPLEARYGPHRFSLGVEEWIIRDFFKDKRGGFFVDVGASDYRTFSNTYYLETQLGWSGIAVDALPQFADGYRMHRPRTRFFAFFVSDRSNETATLSVLRSNTLVSSEQRAFTEGRGGGAQEVQVPTITLDDLLTAENVTQLDLLSMDIELAEPKALAGLTISRYRPALVCVEAHPKVRQPILDYFAGNDYVLVGKYLRADVINLYFMPRR